MKYIPGFQFIVGRSSTAPVERSVVANLNNKKRIAPSYSEIFKKNTKYRIHYIKIVNNEVIYQFLENDKLPVEVKFKDIKEAELILDRVVN